MAELGKKSLDHLEQLLNRTQESFSDLSARLDDFQPTQEFDLKTPEDFHLGFIFGNLEEDFINWFYSKHGRSMTDHEYRQFWKKCREIARDSP